MKKNKVAKLRIKKDDMVRVITGNDKGKEGKVLSVDPEKQRLVVDGVNIRKRHMRPTQSNPEGQIMEREMPIHYSNVMIIDGEGNPTRIGIRRASENGEKTVTRIARTNGQEI